ncbi:hypothetical protein N7468_010768 [Penicillium chermesinum]|uniref:Uncharacterized protein n=1 Tax=Penicillium chermesinum TaxID=63820 RepID=A0A9W9TAC3_9EURO|nr:uncharacterized protein N7468_010768 [Penicillium chermesinum]KAJ5215089.1 hypothetical protein N7468_010768 [Penicillium chermesinum]
MKAGLDTTQGRISDVLHVTNEITGEDVLEAVPSTVDIFGAGGAELRLDTGGDEDSGDDKNDECDNDDNDALSDRLDFGSDEGPIEGFAGALVIGVEVASAELPDDCARGLDKTVLAT